MPPSYWHHEPFRHGEFLLVPIECQKLLSLHNQCRCDMQYIKTAVSSGESVRGGKSFGLIDHVREVADLDMESATSPVGLKLRPEQSRLARRDPFPKLREAEGIGQLILTQGSEGQSASLGFHPSYRPGRVSIVPV